MKTPSVGLFGNTCNTLYQLSKALRSSGAADAHLYIDNRSDPQQLPESDDKSLLNDYPQWIHKGNYITPKSIVAPWTSPLVSEFRKYDLLIVSHLGPMFSQFAGRPTAFFSGGADLTVHPFAPSFLFLYYPTFAYKLGGLIMSHWQKRGIRSCAKVWTQPFAPFKEAVNKLRLTQEQVSNAYFPLIMDSKQFRRRSLDEITQRDALMLRKKFDFLIFHPSRMMINPHPKLIASGNWKQNDLLIRGFARHLKQNQGLKSGLVLIDRPASTDAPIAKQLIAELGIQDSVVWLKPPRSFGFTRDELIDFYSISDLIADEFGVGWFGSIVLEGLCVGTNVMCNVDADAMSTIYPWHPIISVNSEESIADKITELATDRGAASKHALLGPQWIEEFHSKKAVEEVYVSKLRELSALINVPDRIVS